MLMEDLSNDRPTFGKMGYGKFESLDVKAVIYSLDSMFRTIFDRHELVRHDVKQIDKGQFHCDDCGICRLVDNYEHLRLEGERTSSTARNAYLFDSLKDITVMKCGHTMHCECYYELIKREKYCCPICSKSIMDMSGTWKRIEEEIEATVMPDEYRYKKVWILCNDCNDTTEVYFHIIGQKCSHCASYNTRTIGPPVLPQ
ncbi:hypothetical protein RD792_017181 [Penstemon davidsonii]|uniref:RING-type domain-containing protein n=1 Tax=Penstemon davidsonii TaxID=160366 RepID=A0ABR0CLB1_9LAMI|nr:hypothetical protein RD792_017152 [Penstemon davidsonii]KAK4477916.1 hypothetical protein RD792_017181 [Penstemon davidsonii]